MGSDVVGLAVALIAQSLMTSPASPRHTYGFQRAEVLGAEANGVILLATSGWVFYEAFQRLGSPEAINGVGLLIVASLAVVLFDATWVDSVASILIGLLVLWSAWSLLRDTTQVLLESTPRGIDSAAVQRTLVAACPRMP